jgi:anti-sigma factor ChrR (cupin superfamily)
VNEPLIFGRWVCSALFDAERYTAHEGWAPFREGIEILRLHGDGVQGPAAALLRYQPGARVPMHIHQGYEHVLVLTGSQRDEHGRYGPGTWLVHAPGTRHSVVSDDGCVVAVFWAEPVRFEG